ncbi:ATP-binding protein [Actinomadura sp. 7K534]|uniref:ATP-binding protein n=1 Tax=Actinomadura sp. 7K534 TaxID=2530366 RepID=UPI00104B1ACD|nr:ATP-binding protein [Actinomadura sp. 7K534]TDB86902.1 ATP-binding protein [Actinomadura sp. 7K534]
MNTTGTGTTRKGTQAAAQPARDRAAGQTDDEPGGGHGDNAGNGSGGGVQGNDARGALDAGAGTGAPQEADTAAANTAAWDLPAGPRAPAAARALTARALRGWRVTDPGDIGDVVLMVGELVTNAVVHGTGPVRLTLRLDGRDLRAEIGDTAPALPAAPAPPAVPDWSEAGRGLLLVAALATDHGARPEETGKTVWFTRLLNPS